MVELVLFDDVVAREWKPFTWTRPAGELVFGGFSFRERAEQVFGISCAGHVNPTLAGFDEPESPPVVDMVAPAGVDRLYINSRFAPDWDASFDPPAVETLIESDGRIVGWYVPAGSRPVANAMEEPADASSSSLPRVTMPGRCVAHFWDLVTGHADQLRADMVHAVPVAGAPPRTPAHIIGASALRLDAGVSIEPGTVIDCSAGPVWLERGVRIRAFTRLSGPARIGVDSTLLGGTFDTVTIGPVCKVRGEVESTVMLGCSNKSHDGFIGHSYIGRWVNLGALTTNSDLKNNYGPIRLFTHDGTVETGAMKIGCFMGDHVKTAIGTVLNTGTIVGPGSNVFGQEMPPKYMPPFSWGSGTVIHALDRFLETAMTVMGRRGIALTPGVKAILERAWTASRGSPR